ncbi:MAG TPA: hypothetical protein VGB69_06390 [Edaphobacter sp.]
MTFRKKPTAGIALAAVLAVTLSSQVTSAASLFGKKKQDQDLPSTKLSPAQNELVDKSIAREKEIIKALRERAPLVETYIQNMRPDDQLNQAPESDQHFLGRVEFGQIIGGEQFGSAKHKGGKLGFFKQSASFLTGLGGSLHLNFSATGFIQMLLIDSNNFDRDHYQFGYVRNEFLGNVPTAVFDVTPLGKSTTGRFFGRIWIETQEGNVVRLNGSFAGTEEGSREYYHFDSWRTNVQPGLWLPTDFYVEESDSKSVSRTLRFKAVNHIWGYSLKVPVKDSQNTSMDVVGATDVSNEAQDVSPLGAQRQWVQQAEDNVVERLFRAGLVDAPSEFDKTMEALVNNILAYNNINLSRQIHVRTLLTEPLESLAVGNTIILSKSLIDTTAILSQDGAQQMGNLNALLAFQLSHIILGHRLDTKYAFNDSMLFPSTSVFQRIPMHHTDADNEAAAKKAIELLSAKELEGGQQYFGLYLQQLQQRIGALKTLNQPMIGDGLVKSDKDSTFWMAPLIAKSPKLNMADLQQQAATPLASFTRREPWTDQIITLHTAFEPLLSPADKMPFEAAPVYIKLGYYKPPTETPAPAAPAAGAPAAAPQQQPAPADAAPAAGQAAPAAATGTANPPQN